MSKVGLWQVGDFKMGACCATQPHYSSTDDTSSSHFHITVKSVKSLLILYSGHPLDKVYFLNLTLAQDVCHVSRYKICPPPVTVCCNADTLHNLHNIHLKRPSTIPSLHRVLQASTFIIIGDWTTCGEGSGRVSSALHYYVGSSSVN